MDAISVEQPLKQPFLQRILRWMGDLAIVVSIIAVPYTSSTRGELGSAVFVCCSIILAVSWALEHLLFSTDSSRFCGAELIPVAAIGLILFQLATLPDSLRLALSPFQQRYFESGNDANSSSTTFANWKTLSLTPALTRSGLALLCGYSLFVLTLVQKLQNRNDIKRLLKLIAAAGILMLIVGFAQAATGTREFLWHFSHPARTAAWPVKGAFTNQNHFANFITLSLGPLIWWWHSTLTTENQNDWRRSRNRSSKQSSWTTLRTPLLSVCIGAVGLGVISSTSRGGMLAFFVAAVFLMAVFFNDRRKLFRYVIPAVVVVVIGLSVTSLDLLSTKWNAILNSEKVADLSTGRFALWRALAMGFPDVAFVGSGLGSHAEVYPTWMTQFFGKRLSHAESGYFQLLIETGLAGGFLLLTALGLLSLWSRRLLKHETAEVRHLAAAIAAGLLASCAHSVADFVWYKPGCMIPTLALVACLWSLHTIDHTAPFLPNEQKRGWLLSTGPVWACVFLMAALPCYRLTEKALFTAADAESHWLAYRRHNEANHNKETQAEKLERLNIQIQLLEACVDSDPTYTRARSRLALQHCDRFRLIQALNDNEVRISDIAETAWQLTSREELYDWMKRAFGPSAADLAKAVQHASVAIHEQPLQDEAYYCLAETGFLIGHSASTKLSILQQARQVRPFNSLIAWSLAQEQARLGDLEAAGKLFHQVFHHNPRLRPTVIEVLAPVTSVEDFLQTIQPNTVGLLDLFRHYVATSDLHKQQILHQHFQQKFPELRVSSQGNNHIFWIRCAEILSLENECADSILCRRRAVALAPHDYHARRKLAFALMDVKDRQAITQLKWCALRKPNDTAIINAIQQLEPRQAARKRRVF